MQIEYEATFPDIKKREMRQKLKTAGAELVHKEFLQKRVTFNLPKGQNRKDRWIRVRDEGDKITLTYKVVDGDKIHNQKEITIIVDDFKVAVDLLIAIGAKKKSYQETKRELWMLAGVEVTIDEWPYLEPCVEIEGESEKAVKEACSTLSLDYNKALFCSVTTLYKMKYGVREDIINNKIPEITFTGPNPFNKNN